MKAKCIDLAGNERSEGHVWVKNHPVCASCGDKCHEHHGPRFNGPDWLLCQVAHGQVTPEEATRKYDALIRAFAREHLRRSVAKQRAALEANPGILEHELIDLIDPDKQ